MTPLRLVLVAVSSVFAGCGSDGAHDVFLEGRVFWGPSRTEGVDRAFVHIADSTGTRRCVVTSCDGTFKVMRGEVPELSYPIKVAIERAKEPEARSPQALVVRHLVSSTIGGEPSFVLFDSEARSQASKRPPSGVCAPGAAPALVQCPEDRLGP